MISGTAEVCPRRPRDTTARLVTCNMQIVPSPCHSERSEESRFWRISALPEILRSLRFLRMTCYRILGFLETNTCHPSLETHEYSSLRGVNGEKMWEAYAQQNTPAAYRVFFHYGPDRNEKGKRIPVITIVAITSHP